MKLDIHQGLPFVTATIGHAGQTLELANVLLDTGSASTLFPVDQLMTIGIQMAPDDLIHRVRGIGGTEFVFSKKVDLLAIGELRVEQFEIEIGAMDYGFPLNGIIGLDFLRAVRARIDLGELTVT